MEMFPPVGRERSKKWFRAGLILGGFVAAAIVTVCIALLIYARILGAPPLAVPQSSLYFSSTGEKIGESHSGEIRYWIPIEDMSEDLVHATIAVEDRNFYSHPGFDVKRIGGAVLADLRSMSMAQGASTITQQYARNLFLSHEKSWKRKISEAFYTLRLEMNYTKDDILSGYLNTIYYGHGAYGIEAASIYYFGKSAKELTLAESAMIAGVPKGPTYFSPFVNKDKAFDRMNIVLSSMVTNGYITEEEKAAALKERLTFIGQHIGNQQEMAPYFQDAVRAQLQDKIGLDAKAIALGGLRIYTTLNSKHQEIAEQVVAETISEESEIQLGFTSLDPKTGYVTALVGGRNYKESPYNRATQAIRQPGSTMKPLLYYAALERGFTPVTMLRSEPTSFRYDDDREVYEPQNFNHYYANGEITMAQAVAVSDNIYAVKTHLFLGDNILASTAKRFGLTTKMKDVPSLALGTSGVRVIDMANAYGMLANGGVEIEPVLVTKVETYNGEVLYEHKPSEKQQLNPDVAYVTTNMLTGMFDTKLNGYASVTGSSLIPQMTRPYAGKTGSTSSDNWMVGYSPSLSTAIWTGYDEGREITLLSDKLYAKNIWIRFMERVASGTQSENFTPTGNVVSLPIDPKSGKIATNHCSENVRSMYFIKGSEPTEFCDVVSEEQFDTEEETPKLSEPLPVEEKKDKPWWKFW
ncbi:transglycosylase domain-containing protein [Mangrovibacillus cuniculi]|uniref:PBP1A family penicillin-binding protein n=1 Tax=Mangrovibacillus cuniculi TaxID=2593652 RepID=A0A7S8CD77_9BACI|nr:PBP1A family penicillin-binding protein [Mangrovibacillus cuniculi]QPC47757.1 PBP1A family penicillin-binding protein [Mangrovibacillus cuniculi]